MRQHVLLRALPRCVLFDGSYPARVSLVWVASLTGVLVLLFNQCFQHLFAFLLLNLWKIHMNFHQTWRKYTAGTPRETRSHRPDCLFAFVCQTAHFPTVCNLLLMLLFALAPGTGRDSNNYTQPHLSPNHRTHTHINYLLLFTCGQVCMCVCVYGICWAKADVILRLHPTIFKYISHFSSVLFS